MRSFFFGPVLIALASASPAAIAPVSSGGVYVATLPSGADVWIDGTYCGRSPVLLDALPQGRHVLTLTKTGWNVQEAQVDVPGGGITVWNSKLLSGSRAALERGIGSIVLRGLPHDAKVSIDGAPPRELPGVTSLPEGSHTISFSAAHGSVTRSFTVLAEMTSELVLREARAAKAHVGVIAPAGDYLPEEAILLSGRALRIRYQGHAVSASLDKEWMRVDGKLVTYNSAPSLINGKLYLPLDLLDALTK